MSQPIEFEGVARLGDALVEAYAKEEEAKQLFVGAVQAFLTSAELELKPSPPPRHQKHDNEIFQGGRFLDLPFATEEHLEEARQYLETTIRERWGLLRLSYNHIFSVNAADHADRPISAWRKNGTLAKRFGQVIGHLILPKNSNELTLKPLTPTRLLTPYNLFTCPVIDEHGEPCIDLNPL